LKEEKNTIENSLTFFTHVLKTTAVYPDTIFLGTFLKVNVFSGYPVFCGQQRSL
jgi:hypothetical protein